MRFISLFAGIGGFDLALTRAGHKCVWANEWDKYAAQIYDKNFSTKVDTRDIRTIINSEIPNHDLLVGGFPCQSFSIAGKRRGFDDTRGTLFFEIARILREKHTRLFILENVKGLLSHDNGNTFKTIITTLTELGYDLQWQVLNSKNFGVPQNRERVFIIGNLRGTSRPQVFPIRDNDEVYNRPNEDKEKIHDIASTLTARQFASWNGNYIKQINSPIHSNDRVYGIDGISPTLNTMQGGRRQPFVAVKMERSDEAKKIRREMMKQGRDWSPRQGKKLGIREDELMNTITANWEVNQAVTNLVKIRRLTPTECERLQGFPDGWTEGISDTQRYKCLGNAVTVNVIEYIVSKL